MKKIVALLVSLLLIACETTITPELSGAERIIVVDAWLNQKMERQEIRITRSQPYFENTHPEKISGATVRVYDLITGEMYDFVENESLYFWDPSDKPFGIIGNHYRLIVTIAGETFEAFSKLGRVPPIDSIEFTYNEEDLLYSQNYYMAQFSAVEPVGVGDTYWIKVWKNGQHLNKPGELNMTYDASFTPGIAIDGQQFALPIRKDFLNPYDTDPEKGGKFLPPYLVNDSVYVEIHSIDPVAYQFLFGVYFHTTRPGGVAELFATPLGNAITNLKSTDANSTTNIAGFFNVAAVSGKGQRLTEHIAEIAKLNHD